MGDKSWENFDFILASASPRRRQLLKEYGYNFGVYPSDIDESVYNRDNPVEYVKKLALAKAWSVAEKFPDKLILGADTIAEADGEIIGKAENQAQAKQIVELLFSKKHRVITGVGIVRVCDNTEIAFADTTVIYPAKITDKQIKKHIASGSWRGKAGAYAIQENGDEMIDKIAGSFTNVVGLPMEKVSEILDRYI